MQCSREGIPIPKAVEAVKIFSLDFAFSFFSLFNIVPLLVRLLLFFTLIKQSIEELKRMKTFILNSKFFEISRDTDIGPSR